MVMNRRYLVAGAAAFILLAVILWSFRPALMPTNSRQTRPIRLGVVGFPEALDPALASSHSEILVASAVYEPLVRYDETTGSLKPCLAYNWGYSEDGRSLVFMLGSAPFHNGRRLTAEAVKESWETAVRIALDKNRKALFSGVVGFEEYINERKPDITGIKALNSNTLQVDLKRPDSSFVYKVTNPVFWVADRRDAMSIPSGTGPYMIGDIDSDSRIVLQVFSHYHGQTPRITALEFIGYRSAKEALYAFKSGRLDYLDQVPFDQVASLTSDPALKEQVLHTPLFGIYALGMNVNRSPFNDAYLRRALNYGVDRDMILKSILGGAGIPSKGIIPMGLPGYNSALQGYPYDPDRAYELMEESSIFRYTQPPSVDLYYNEDPGHEKVAQSIAAQLDSLALTVNPLPLPWDEYLRRMEAMNFNFFRFGWDADYPDPDAFLYPLFHSSQIGITNLTGYKNPRVDRLLDQARAETASNSRRLELLRKAEKIILDDAPMIWLFQKESVKLVSPEIRGLQVNGMELIDWSKLDFSNEKQGPT